MQSSESAIASEMPRNAINRVAIDHVVHPMELPGLLLRLVGEAAPEQTPAVSEAIAKLEGNELGNAAEIVCPICHGVLTEATVGDYQHFRCHVGHAFSTASLVREQGEELERALWAAARSLEEGSALSRRLAASSNEQELKRRFAEKAATLSRQADLIREILLYGGASSLPRTAEG